MRRAYLAGLALLGAGSAFAQNFAWQWPITLPRANEPAYEVVLDESVYASLADPLLRDMLVIDASGRPLPTTIRAPREQTESAPVIQTVPWFLLTAQTDAASRAHAVEGQFESAGVSLSWRVPEAGPDTAAELLLDLGGDSRKVRAIHLQAAEGDPAWRARIEVLASDDLQRWSPAARPTSVYRLVQDGHALALLSIPLDRAPERYLRLRHTGDSAGGSIAGVSVERRDQPMIEREPLRWLRLQPTPAADGVGWTYETPGPMRIEAWDLAAGEGNWLLRTTLSSRSDADASWQQRAAGERYQWMIDHERAASPPSPLAARRDRFWRVEVEAPREAPPALLLGYRPDRLLFLSEVDPPYRLAAGSGNVRRTDAPTAAVLAAIRQHRGKDWDPLSVRLGPRQELAGLIAMTPTRTPLDWKAALLWSVLIAVAGSVVVIGLKLLRQPEGGSG